MCGAERTVRYKIESSELSLTLLLDLEMETVLLSSSNPEENFHLLFKNRHSLPFSRFDAGISLHFKPTIGLFNNLKLV